MSERYLPGSEFLNHIFADEISLEGSPQAEANLKHLLSLVDDLDRSNRDWAAFFIVQSDLDTPAVRAALLTACDDDDEDTRDEALLGLARRDQAAALVRIAPLLDKGLGVALLEAAAILAAPELLPKLTEMRGWEGSAHMHDLLERAIAASEKGEWKHMGTA